ncbi:PqiB family protein [Silvimonas iriomotensis]|uniref:Paraquat-inducible protein n=1 Tax=Silvimonas iriomotensis TaxID=449662 RepID=A0ABQ2P598_9NEIS|nr:MlaD family protein [Silvimonas iriomotensis]GGP18413.1 paraquat-inducible protein [Silvimonas iriomotensis]
MTDQTHTPAPQDEDIPSAKALPKRRLPSLIWLIPIVAALAGGWIAVHAIMQRGPTITIRFDTAEGIEAGKTKIKYKDVDIGNVTGVVLTEDRQHIKVTAQLAHATDDLLGDKTQFWVVRPRVAGGTVSGLSTLLSGAFIGIDPARKATDKRDFVGLEQAPIVTTRQAGREFVLKAQDMGSIDVGTPLFFRRVQVGEVSAYTLDKDGKGITVKAFVHAPYDQYVTSNTRFWHASGVDVSLDANGLRIETQSLASIAIGGIAFQAPPDQPVAEPAAADTQFTLAADRNSAMKEADRERAPFVLYFRESLRGLSVGAPVDFRGITIGEVKAINFEFSKEKREILMPVTIDLYPDRLRGRMRQDQPIHTPAENVRILNAMVAHGLRAQLRTGNLITGQLYIALDFMPGASKADIDWKQFPPSLPSVAGSLTQLQDTALSIAKKLDALPIESIGKNADQAMRNANKVLDNADQLVSRLKNEVTPEAQTTLKAAQDAINQAKQTLSPDAPVQQNMNDTLQEVSKAAQAFRDLSDYLSRHPDALLRGQKEDAK